MRDFLLLRHDLQTTRSEPCAIEDRIGIARAVIAKDGHDRSFPAAFGHLRRDLRARPDVRSGGSAAAATQTLADFVRRRDRADVRHGFHAVDHIGEKAGLDPLPADAFYAAR